MRLVQVLIPAGKRKSVLEVLDKEQIDYVVWDETGRGDFEALVQFPIPSIGVEPVLEKLREAGLSKGVYTIVLSPETVISENIDILKKRYSGERISREELVARAQNLAPAASTFFAFLILSTVIATAGLLLDSAATIIGAMVVAPLMGPAISASVGTVVDDRKLVSRGVMLQVTGLLLAIAVSALLGFFIKESFFLPPELDIRDVSQIAERISPNFLYVLLALGSGFAGAVSIMRNVGSALVGVAIAIALIPPAATSGLGLAWGIPEVAIAAALLVVINMLAINMSTLVLFWLAGFRPLEPSAIDHARYAVISHGAVLLGAIAVLSLILILISFASFQAYVVEQQVKEEVTAIFEDPVYAERGLTLAELTVNYEPADFLFEKTVIVDVVVAHPVAQEVPEDIAVQIDSRLTGAMDKEFNVNVGFIEAQQVA
ncbi:TIGR00341 family protein [Methanosarcina hadiensis]|uniref:TIGR00341 family protein n=1 Tax=Methanosarcina hadiensis TaxID=3078083 RepID=UPI0039774342